MNHIYWPIELLRQHDLQLGIDSCKRPHERPDPSEHRPAQEDVEDDDRVLLVVFATARNDCREKVRLDGS